MYVSGIRVDLQEQEYPFALLSTGLRRLSVLDKILCENPVQCGVFRH